MAKLNDLQHLITLCLELLHFCAYFSLHTPTLDFGCWLIIFMQRYSGSRLVQYYFGSATTCAVFDHDDFAAYFFIKPANVRNYPNKAIGL